MTHEPARRALRMPFTAPVRVRGTCGHFGAHARDISLAGVRIRIARSELRLAEAADLATAAATVQTRVGSRFVVELGLLQRSSRLTKAVTLVRLVVPPDAAGHFDLGCAFDRPLSSTDLRTLNLTLPDRAAHLQAVRRDHTWAEEGRVPIDPALAAEKVHALFGVTDSLRAPACERHPQRSLRVIVSEREGRGTAPLVCAAETLTSSTILMRVAAEHASTWLEHHEDIAEVIRAARRDLGAWPDLEIVDGGRRLWQGPAHVCGFELGAGPEGDVFLRLAFGQRLRQVELERLCAA